MFWGRGYNAGGGVDVTRGRSSKIISKRWKKFGRETCLLTVRQQQSSETEPRFLCPPCGKRSYTHFSFVREASTRET